MRDLISDALPPRKGADPLTSPRRYQRIFLAVVLTVSAVAIGPLLVMTGLEYTQSKRTFGVEQSRQRLLRVEAGRRWLEAFLEQRTAALEYAALDKALEELGDELTLGVMLRNLQASFGGFTDLGVVDQGGTLIAYAGPFEPEEKDYLGSPGFLESSQEGAYVSDVFLGYRDLPHFVLSLRRRYSNSMEIVLRASLDSEVLTQIAEGLNADSVEDAFIINREKILQTSSRFRGNVLERATLPVPADLVGSGQIEYLASSEGPRLLSYAVVSGSPFIVTLVGPTTGFGRGLATLRRNLFFFVGTSALLILGVVIWGARWMVNRTREADLQRAAAFHQLEYSNKMAALGRLSAGVAHEINNPVAVITQQAGLFKDLLLLSEAPPPKEKMMELLDSVVRSAERCGDITHRLLGFARHVEVEAEELGMDSLIREVLGFLEKEASYRGIEIVLGFPEDPPNIQSDRGQLQQVFLNIINNAFAAVDDGGRIEIGIDGADPERVRVWIQDDGVGIPDEILRHIFEPFFSTKKGSGTGLGLSITYGIVKKLGGDISVQTTPGEGTRFTVTLPRTLGED